MNGRVYDPVLGKMLSPDLVVQDPGYSESYNRYTYCFNNPLKYTDPSGYEGEGWSQGVWNSHLVDWQAEGWYNMNAQQRSDWYAGNRGSNAVDAETNPGYGLRGSAMDASMDVEANMQRINSEFNMFMINNGFHKEGGQWGKTIIEKQSVPKFQISGHNYSDKEVFSIKGVASEIARFYSEMAYSANGGGGRPASWLNKTFITYKNHQMAAAVVSVTTDVTETGPSYGDSKDHPTFSGLNVSYSGTNNTTAVASYNGSYDSNTGAYSGYQVAFSEPTSFCISVTRSEMRVFSSKDAYLFGKIKIGTRITYFDYWQSYVKLFEEGKSSTWPRIARSDVLRDAYQRAGGVLTLDDNPKPVWIR